jgi:DMSO/TMAO reductase YedYZ heme-binding membrane subunit
MNSTELLTISLGNLEISEISAAALLIVSLIFLTSFAIVSLKNDSKGMMEWMFDNKANQKR